jgi:hypothetical protein
MTDVRKKKAPTENINSEEQQPAPTKYTDLLYTNYSLEIFLESFDHVVIKIELGVPPKVLLSPMRERSESTHLHMDERSEREKRQHE